MHLNSLTMYQFTFQPSLLYLFTHFFVLSFKKTSVMKKNCINSPEVTFTCEVNSNECHKTINTNSGFKHRQTMSCVICNKSNEKLKET